MLNVERFRGEAKMDVDTATKTCTVNNTIAHERNDNMALTFCVIELCFFGCKFVNLLVRSGNVSSCGIHTQQNEAR